MNYSDYQQRIKEFAVYPRIGNNLSYAVLGLINEFGEFLEKCGDFDNGDNDAFDGIKDEAGDCYWYFGACYNEINEDWSKVLMDNAEPYERGCNNARHTLENEEEIVICSLSMLFGRLSGYAKKAERDNNGKLLDKHRPKFIETLLVLQAILSCLLEEYGVLLVNAIDNNVAKLESRKERNVLHGDGDNR